MDSFNTAYTTPWNYGAKGEHYKPQIRTEKEANYVQVRSGASRSREKNIHLPWDKIPISEYQDIIEFFDAHIGEAFTWTNEATGVTHIVVFAQDTIPYEFVAHGKMKIDVYLEEL
ncbi:MAG: hypothetical protein KA801_10405 [Syntrophorhabdaceae bacterium]|nr:hypothetical protein [Syntrophorhabdaceae bacterium]